MIETNKVYQGDTLQILKTWPDEFVQCIVTSPPYWGLRDYGVNGQIGLESTPEEYTGKIVEVFNQIRRILKKDGTLWLNLGDSYSGCGRGGAGIGDKQFSNKGSLHSHLSNIVPEGLKPKNMVGIPWRVAFALQKDDWYLRSDIIWSKPNAMPESVTDRPTKSHEYIFLFCKSERYFYNAPAIYENRVSFENRPDGCDRLRDFGYDSKYSGIEGNKQNLKLRKSDRQRGHSRRHNGFNDRWDLMSHKEQSANGRNKRTVWEIPTSCLTEAHFATFPEDIPTICIKAGSRHGDIVLDPFMGSGTVGIVAKRLKRRWLGIDLNPEYVEMAERRIRQEQEPLLVEGAA